MRFMVIVKATPESESGDMGKPEDYAEMGRYNEELVKAGVMLAGEGLHPSSKGFKVAFAGGERTVVDGPFTETKELIAGFWILQVKSRDEVVEWVKRIPFREGAVEVRQVFETEDFGEVLSEEERAREERLRATIEEQHGA